MSTVRDQGIIDPGLRYEAPLSDTAPTGPEEIFGEERVRRLFTRIKAINNGAVAQAHLRASGDFVLEIKMIRASR